MTRLDRGCLGSEELDCPAVGRVGEGLVLPPCWCAGAWIRADGAAIVLSPPGTGETKAGRSNSSGSSRNAIATRRESAELPSSRPACLPAAQPPSPAASRIARSIVDRMVRLLSSAMIDMALSRSWRAQPLHVGPDRRQVAGLQVTLE